MNEAERKRTLDLLIDEMLAAQTRYAMSFEPGPRVYTEDERRRDTARALIHMMFRGEEVTHAMLERNS